MPKVNFRLLTINENGDVETYPDTRKDFVALEENKQVNSKKSDE
jgi:hypothetical protein